MMTKAKSRERAARFTGDGSEFVFDEAAFLTESAEPFPQFQEPLGVTFQGKKYIVLQPNAEFDHALAVDMMQERGYELGPLQGTDDLPFHVVKRAGEDERQVSPERLAAFLKTEDDRI